ncbi:NAD(P)H-quinone oxidoreductase subunit H, chloroplastic, partial [Cucurbita argyrosperma subsp. argyrosperma]
MIGSVYKDFGFSHNDQIISGLVSTFPGCNKLQKTQPIRQYLPYLTPWDYLATIFTEAITVNGQELLGNIQVPKRSLYLQRKRISI